MKQARESSSAGFDLPPREGARDPSSLYPPIHPHAQGMLAVGDGHHIYWEVSGNPSGVPVVFLHGGPGGGCDARHRRFFDPRHYRIVLFDQRGCGRSRPTASLFGNTTWSLIEDIERLRTHLGIDRWLISGGSWGSTLALAYAQRHVTRVAGLILRGVFTFTDAEYDWFFRDGAPQIFPEYWAEFVGPIPPEERSDVIAAYHRRLVGQELGPPQRFDEPVRLAFARAWSAYECRLASFRADRDADALCRRSLFVLPFARIECHYLRHRAFLSHPYQLLDDAPRLRDVPIAIVHGRYDMVCPFRSAWLLARALPHAELTVVDGAGHSAFEPGICDALVAASDRLR